MGIYIALVIVCAANGAFMDKYHNRCNKNFRRWLYFTFILLFFISALRFEVGQDYTDTYVLAYQRVVAGVKNVRMDIAVKTIYKGMAKLHANAQWIFVITSFIINWFACKSIAMQSPDCKLSFLIYLCGTFYFFSMNGVRQSVAMMLFYYSFRFIEEKNLKVYLVINGIGALFHSSALLFLPLYFVLNKKIKFKFKLALIIGTIVTSKIAVPIIASVLMKTHYSMYLTNGYYSAQETMNFSMYLNIMLFLIYEWFSKKEKLDELGHIYDNIHFCGVIVSLLATSLPLMIRIFMSFRFIEFLSVPYLLNMQLKKRNRQIIEPATMVLYFAYFVWGVLIKNGNTVLPYKTIFCKLW